MTMVDGMRMKQMETQLQQVTMVVVYLEAYLEVIGGISILELIPFPLVS